MLIKIPPPGAGNSFIFPRQGIVEDAEHLSKIRFLLMGKEREMVVGYPPTVSPVSISCQLLHLLIPPPISLKFTLAFAQVPNISYRDSWFLLSLLQPSDLSFSFQSVLYIMQI